MRVLFAAIVSVALAMPAWAQTGPATRPSSPSFLDDVMPIFDRLGCAAAQCHGAMYGKGGLKLSMFGADPETDHEAVTKSAASRRINRVEPANSLLLQKTSGALPHEGKSPLTPGSANYQLILNWIAAGAPYHDARRQPLASIKLAPNEVSLTKGESRQLRVMGVFTDGSSRDFTSAATCRSLDPTVATVDRQGAVLARSFGQTFIIASFRRQFAVMRIAVPQPLNGTFPQLKQAGGIDELCYWKLQELGLVPSDLCTDEVFLRRVYLDTIGALPTAEEARQFLAEKDQQKRARLIDQLVQRDEFADFWALKWGDLLRIKSEYPVKVWPKGVQAYHRWVREAIARNMPIDQFARELLVSSGSNFRDGPANFYRAVNNKDAQSFAEEAALLFMGTRLSCARCHGHPHENWTLEDNLGVAAFFAKMRFKATLEWKEEIVYLDPSATLRHPKTGGIVKPQLPGGKSIAIENPDDPRAAFANWLTTSDNPWFARNIVNRIWSWLMGRGIVHEPDDIRATNPPSNAALLEFLAQELVRKKYDTRHIYRLILNSNIYQLSSRTNESNAGDHVHYSHYFVKRLAAEQLLDAISRVTETSETFRSQIPEPYSRLPRDQHSVALADGSISTPFLELFGRPPRDTPYESDRCSQASMRQALHLMNSSDLEGKIAGSPRLKRWLTQKTPDSEVVDELYLSALSRFPTPAEKQKILAHLSADPKTHAQAMQDLIWAILNTKEFLFIH